MNYKIIIILETFIGVVNGNFSASSQLISSLNKFYHFDLNIYLKSNVDLLRREGINNDTVLRTIITCDNDKTAKFTKCGNNIFLIATMNSTEIERNLVLNVVKKLFQANIEIKIGIFYDKQVTPSFLEISKLFQWCWSFLILNVFVTYYTEMNTLHSLTFNPFGSFSVINLTDLNPDKYFTSKTGNLQGHQIRTYLINEYQTAFLTKNNTSLAGPHGNLYSFILEKMNATLHVPLLKIEPYDTQKVKKLFENKSFDIFPQAIIVVSSHSFLTTIGMENLNVLVPQSKPYTIINALILSILNKCAFLVLSSIILFIVLSLIFIRFVQSGKFLVLKSFTQTSVLLITGNIHLNSRKLTKSEILILVPWTFAGVVITTFIFSVLYNHLTVTTYEPEVNTFQDIEQYGCNIHAPGQGIADKVREIIGENLFHKISIVNSEEIMHNIAIYNTSNCYLLTDSRIQAVLERQKRLNIKGFHLPKQYASKVPCSFLIRPDLPYVDKMNYIILRSFDSGLFLKWKSDLYYELVEIDYFPKTFVSNVEVTNYYVLSYILVLGWCFSVICFIFEILYFQICNIVLRYA